MKELKGTPKQIAWAEDIRNKALETCDNNIKNYTDQKEKYETNALDTQIKVLNYLKEQLIQLFDKEESAEKIIAGRDNISSDSILKKYNLLMCNKNTREQLGIK